MKPFISYGNEMDLYSESLFLPKSALEIILFRYILMFEHINHVEKCICFAHENQLLNQEVYQSFALVNSKDSELFLDIEPGNGEIFVHMTHEKKRKDTHNDFFERYYQTISPLVSDLHIHQDQTCPFAESFSCSYDPLLIKESNKRRYDLLKANLSKKNKM